MYLLIFSHLRLSLPGEHFPSCFPTIILYGFLILPRRATCPAHTLFDFITLILFGEAYKF